MHFLTTLMVKKQLYSWVKNTNQYTVAGMVIVPKKDYVWRLKINTVIELSIDSTDTYWIVLNKYQLYDHLLDQHLLSFTESTDTTCIKPARNCTYEST